MNQISFASEAWGSASINWNKKDHFQKRLWRNTNMVEMGKS